MGARREHFTLGGGFEVAMVLLIKGHAAEGVVVGFEGGLERGDFHVEGVGGVPRSR